ncbi:MAG: outer membrane lipoprotein-sorting protein [Limnochordaceae bacterium]|nr:outer membrane lipoprotein-sorting protein [Limnochordaceae bacterium]
MVPKHLRVISVGALTAASVAAALFTTGAAKPAGPSATEILDHLTGTAVVSGSGQAELGLTTENARGQQRTNRLRIYRLESDDGTTRQLLEYLDPPDVRGTKILSINEPGKAAQIWLYLPAVGRERRIAGSAMQDQFMGTDFTYDEISGGTTYKEDYTAERLADATVDGREAYVLRLTPKSPDKKYSYVQMWVWKETYLPLRIDFFDQSRRLEKQLLTADFRQDAQGKVLPYRITMASVKAGTRTLVQLLSMRTGDVPEEYFTLRYLRR